MFRYILHKFAYGILTLYGVVTVVFVLFMVFGNPAKMLLDNKEDKEQLDNINAKYGFDKSKFTQYLYYINDLNPISFHSTSSDDFTFYTKDKYGGQPLFTVGNCQVVLKAPYLRTSLQKNDKKVTTILSETFPNTAILAVASISIAIILGILMGVLAALYKDTWIDKLVSVGSILGMSVPSFFSAILFAWLFGFVLHRYTNLNMTGSLYEVDDFGEGIRLQWKNLLLPAIVLGIRPLAVILQLTRNSLLEVFNQDYIRTAKAKGLTAYQIIKNHALKNAMNPVITAISGWFASMLAGAVFVEFIFNWNGLGKEIVSALNTSDLPVIMGSVLLIALIFILINILVDLLYSWLYPRIRIDTKS